jgi:class 3 adenylate cyclase/predicted ATPase
MRCAACGKENGQGRSFCASCGAALREPCAICGFGNDPVATFCGGCGRRRATLGLDEPPARAWPTAERRQLTLLFCDLCQSTALSDRLDPEDMREVLEAYRARCSAALERYRGTVAYYMGDGILAYFGYPTAHEDDAVRAVRAALEIVPAIVSLGRDWRPPLPLPLQVRIAVHTGLVVAGEIGVDQRRSELWAVGKAPNVAARLQALATPDTIVISEASYRLVKAAFATTSLGRHELEGVNDTIEVFRVEGERRLTKVLDPDAAPSQVTMVNREVELALLEQTWAQVQRGSGQAVLLSGEPGIGKSRLVRSVTARLEAAAHQVILLAGSAYFSDSPLHPVVEFLEQSTAVRKDSTPEEQLEHLERYVGSIREQIPDLVEVMADLLGIVQTRYSALAVLAPRERRARTLDVLCEFVLALAQEKPAAIVFEDLHWTDPTTREWLRLLLDRLHHAPLLALIAVRSDALREGIDPASVQHIPVDRLGREESAEIVDQLIRGAGLDRQLRERILVAADGVPLFVEELTKALIESSQAAPLPAGSAVVPATIQDSLTARLDRLGDTKRVAQVAATIGREFTRDLLGAVVELPDAALDSSLTRLVSSGLVLPLGGSGSRFAFKHSLVRDAAYNGLLRTTRRTLHAKIVEVLETSFPALVAASPELAAQHSVAAQAHDKAAHYWLQAGRIAVARSANVEAVSHLERGLQSLRSLPRDDATDRRELGYLVTLGPSLILSQGPGAQRVEMVYRQAVELCERVEPSSDHVAALWGWWRISPGIHAQLERAERLFGLAQRLGDPGVLLQAHHCLWATRFNLSDLQDSWRHIQAGLKLYEQGDYRGQADFFGGHDARVCGSGEAALVLWHLGSAEQALRYCLDALSWSERLGHAGSRLHALDIAVTFRRYRREPEAARKLAQRMIDLGHERGLADHHAKGRLYLGWAIAASGERERGIAMMNEAFAVERVSGTPEDFSIYSDMLAECLVEAGRAGTALDEVERAIEEAEERVWPIWLPELHRRRGEVLLALSAPRVDEAEACFGEALSLARAQQSVALELRAATSLARLRRKQQLGDRSREPLASVYRQFQEGFDTLDLREARRELEISGSIPVTAPPSVAHDGS